MTISGATTIPAAGDLFRRLVEEAGVRADFDLRLLPDPALGPRTEALVRAPIAPVYRRPTMSSTQVTQYVLGVRLTLLSRRGRFFRVRGEDAHVGWVHRGYLARGEVEWALAWERAEQGEPVVSLGAEVQDQADRVFARLPWGARVIQQAGGRILLPDGRAGHIGSGEVVAADRLSDRFPPRGESVIRTARRWLGAPYLWGGVTPHGVDCSGLIQSVCWIHGIALPRDSDMQALLGVEIDPGPDFAYLDAGDLAVFAEKRRVNHVALSLGGSHIIHASAGNGTVDLNDLRGELDYERFLRRIFRGARRLLPD
jgi:gamma-D-glutamyl-L-lysine dipeptidyl-peptidase